MQLSTLWSSTYPHGNAIFKRGHLNNFKEATTATEDPNWKRVPSTFEMNIIPMPSACSLHNIPSSHSYHLWYSSCPFPHHILRTCLFINALSIIKSLRLWAAIVAQWPAFRYFSIIIWRATLKTSLKFPDAWSSHGHQVKSNSTRLADTAHGPVRQHFWVYMNYKLQNFTNKHIK